MQALPRNFAYGLKALIDEGGTKIGLMYCLEVASLCSYLNDGIKKSPEVGSKVVESYQQVGGQTELWKSQF